MQYYQKTGLDPIPDSARMGWKYSPKLHPKFEYLDDFYRKVSNWNNDGATEISTNGHELKWVCVWKLDCFMVFHSLCEIERIQVIIIVFKFSNAF